MQGAGEERRVRCNFPFIPLHTSHSDFFFLIKHLFGTYYAPAVSPVTWVVVNKMTQSGCKVLARGDLPLMLIRKNTPFLQADAALS